MEEQSKIAQAAEQLQELSRQQETPRKRRRLISVPAKEDPQEDTGLERPITVCLPDPFQVEGREIDWMSLEDRSVELCLVHCAALRMKVDPQDERLQLLLRASTLARKMISSLHMNTKSIAYHLEGEAILLKNMLLIFASYRVSDMGALVIRAVMSRSKSLRLQLMGEIIHHCRAPRFVSIEGAFEADPSLASEESRFMLLMALFPPAASGVFRLVKDTVRSNLQCSVVLLEPVFLRPFQVARSGLEHYYASDIKAIILMRPYFEHYGDGKSISLQGGRIHIKLPYVRPGLTVDYQACLQRQQFFERELFETQDVYTRTNVSVNLMLQRQIIDSRYNLEGVERKNVA
jgi:hypothetical protein